MRSLIFDTQKAELENLQAKTPKERKGIAWAVRLNRQTIQFAAEDRNLEAHVQYMFVEAVMTAIRNGRYESDFKMIVDAMTGHPVSLLILHTAAD